MSSVSDDLLRGSDRMPRYCGLLSPVQYSNGCKWSTVYSWLNKIPTVTNSLGSEGLLNRTYDSLHDTKNLDLKSPYFRPDRPASFAADHEVEGWYRRREKADGLLFGGYGFCQSPADYQQAVCSLKEDYHEWSRSVQNGLDILGKRFNSDLLERVMVNSLNEAILTLPEARKKNEIQRLVWSKYLQK